MTQEVTRAGSPVEASAEGAATAQGAKGPDELRRQIERTRHELGDTVEELAGKMDVKGRARARADDLRDKAGAMTVQLRSSAAHAGQAGLRYGRPVLIAGAAAVAVVGAGTAMRRYGGAGTVTRRYGGAGTAMRRYGGAVPLRGRVAPPPRSRLVRRSRSGLVRRCRAWLDLKSG